MAAPAEAQSELSEKVLALTGSRTKVVWIRGSRDAGGKLMCFDTSEGKERDVVPSMNKCQDPKLTPDASRILFNYPDKTSWIVNWDGSGLKQLFNGRFHYIQGVAKDPKTGVEWVYVSDVWSKEAVPELKERGWNGNAPNGTDFGLSIYRYRLDDLSGKELVWDKQYINQRVEIALDGSQIWGEIPHPHCAVAQVPNGSLKIYHKGCNGNLAPDGSGLFFALIGDHRQIAFYNKDGSRRGNIRLNVMPGIEKNPERKVWRPRWCINNVRFFGVQSGDIQPPADIHIGKFSEDFSRIEGWVQICDSQVYNGESVVWIQPEEFYGETLTEGLNAPLLGDLIRRLEDAPVILPVAQELMRVSRDRTNAERAAEAERVMKHLEGWCVARLEQLIGLSESKPFEAAQACRALAMRYRGFNQSESKISAALAKQPAFRLEVAACDGYAKVLAYEKKFVAVPGMASTYSEKAWADKNRAAIQGMTQVGRVMWKSYSHTISWEKSREIMERYELFGARKTK